MEILIIILAIYLSLGIIATTIICIKEPLIIYAWWLLPLVVFIFPYALWAVFTSDNTGRWI